MSETVKCLADSADEIIEVAKTKENSSEQHPLKLNKI